MSVLVLCDVCKNFGKTEIIRKATVAVERGERHAIIGPNGAGKSTLFNLISGRLRATSGSIMVRGDDVTSAQPHMLARRGLSRSFQISNLFGGLSVRENVLRALMRKSGYSCNPFRFPARDREMSQRADDLLALSELETKAGVLAGELAYADQRSLEIAMTIASDPSIVLLDEPTAGMSRDETRRAIDRIRRMTEGRTLLIVEHDMDVVFSLADRISVLVRGHFIETGSPQQIRASEAVKEAYLGYGKAHA